MSADKNKLYTKDHEWLSKEEGGTAFIGVSQYAADEMGDIVFVEFPEVGDSIEKGKSFGVLESPKAVSDLYMPVSGTITEINSALDDEPGYINENAYETWIVKIKLDDDAQLASLLSPEAYEDLLKKIAEEHEEE